MRGGRLFYLNGPKAIADATENMTKLRDELQTRDLSQRCERVRCSSTKGAAA